MSRFRLRIGFCLAVVAISLIVLGVHGFALVAAAAQPGVNAQAFAQAMHVQNRHTDRLMVVPGVLGTATGLDAAGQPVVRIFLERHGIGGIPARLEGVPVTVEVTGEFYALRQPARPGATRNTAPTVVIHSPADGDRYASKENILFWGEASDREDGNLSARIKWSSNVDGPIGTGAVVYSDLSDGEHTITASVTDSGGKTGKASVGISVGSHPPLWCPRPVPIGVSTGHPDITAGTIGCRVVYVGPDGSRTVYALSNNHVYANENLGIMEGQYPGIPGDNVLQPGPYDYGKDPDDAIGTLIDFTPIAFNTSYEHTMDAAIARTSTSLLGNATPSNGYGRPKSSTVRAKVGLNVKKYGRTTGQTQGRVYAVNATVLVGYDSGWARFVNQIIVTPGNFSAGGDSGSLVVVNGGKDDRKPVGLLFAGSSTMTVCNPIDAVLDFFIVEIDGE